MSAGKLDREDLDYVLSASPNLWEPLRGKRLLITGGTGFFGCWLLETLAWANEQLALNVEAVVLSRDATAFARKWPHLAALSGVQFIPGDVRDFVFPAGDFSHVIHAAAETSASLGAENPDLTTEIIIGGTRRVLEFAERVRPQRVLFVSSGAVYGRQPPGMFLVPENHPQALADGTPRTAYGEAKRQAEELMAAYQSRSGREVAVARGFAFVGPYLPLDQRFAVGNFVNDALQGRTIQVKGDGLARRSYLYGADLALQLWSLLLDPRGVGTFNVGAEEHHSIREIAELVARAAGGGLSIELAKTPLAPVGSVDWYVPDTRLMRDRLGLTPRFGLLQAIAKTLSFHGRSR